MYTYAERARHLPSNDELEQRRNSKESVPEQSHPVAQLQRMIGNRAVAQLASAETAARRKSGASGEASSDRENRTGMPDNLKAGLENLSGMDLSDVKVHYNSEKPSQLQALAYAQGTDIHVGPGQEAHLPHEGWHVVQQKQGRVKPTMNESGVAINDDAALESEADLMGMKALQMKADKVVQRQQTEIYVKNITGTYTDDSGTQHEIKYSEDTLVATTKSHPKGKVSYDDQVKKMLKKNGIVPKTVPDDQITVSYEQYGRKL